MKVKQQEKGQSEEALGFSDRVISGPPMVFTYAKNAASITRVIIENWFYPQALQESLRMTIVTG